MLHEALPYQLRDQVLTFCFQPDCLDSIRSFDRSTLDSGRNRNSRIVPKLNWRQQNEAIHHSHRIGRSAGSRKRRHRSNGPQTISESSHSPRLRHAFSSSTGAICPAKNPIPNFVLNFPRYKGASVLARPRQLRLRLQPRTRSLGHRRLRLPRDPRAQLCRHFLQQLLQKRHSARRTHRRPNRRTLQAHRKRRRLFSSPSICPIKPSATTTASPTNSKLPRHAKKSCCEGLDDIGTTLKHEPDITAYEKTHARHRHHVRPRRHKKLFHRQSLISFEFDVEFGLLQPRYRTGCALFAVRARPFRCPRLKPHHRFSF